MSRRAAPSKPISGPLMAVLAILIAVGPGAANLGVVFHRHSSPAYEEDATLMRDALQRRYQAMARSKIGDSGNRAGPSQPK